MTWFVAAASLIATWLNVRRNGTCFVIWIVTNFFWAGVCFHSGLPAQGCLHVVYLGMAIWGLRRWERRVPFPTDLRDTAARRE